MHQKTKSSANIRCRHWRSKCPFRITLLFTKVTDKNNPNFFHIENFAVKERDFEKTLGHTCIGYERIDLCFEIPTKFRGYHGSLPKLGPPMEVVEFS